VSWSRQREPGLTFDIDPAAPPRRGRISALHGRERKAAASVFEQADAEGDDQYG
jgi:hypothetical protein